MKEIPLKTHLHELKALHSQMNHNQTMTLKQSTQPSSHFENRNNSDRKLKRAFGFKNGRNKKSWGYKGSSEHDVQGAKFNDTR